MRFEYDPSKSAANRQKHGIDFEQAQELWNDPGLLEIPNGSHWSAVITYRIRSIRLISVRRSRPDEIDLYNSPTL